MRLPEMHCMQSRPISLLANCQRGRLRPCSGAHLKHCGRRTLIVRALTLQAPVTLGNVTTSPRPELLRAIKSIYTHEYEEIAFASNYSIEGPLFNCSSREELKRARSLLLSVADVNYVVQSLSPVEGNKLRARWTLEAKLKGIPGQRKLVITGSSLYTLTDAGVFSGQVDTWDAVPGGTQLDSIAFLLRNALSLQLTPDLDTPQYSVLKKTREYEIRRYESFLIAEVDMPQSSSPASGSGFNELANFIFGGNDRKQSMEMTTPVLTTAGQQGEGSNRMAFVMESKYASLEALPVPRNSRVVRKQQEGCVMAALSFGGLPLDFQVTEAERKLRGLLLLDGFMTEGASDYLLARYNSPFELLRRNEILIRLKDIDIDH